MKGGLGGFAQPANPCQALVPSAEPWRQVPRLLAVSHKAWQAVTQLGAKNVMCLYGNITGHMTSVTKEYNKTSIYTLIKRK